MSENWICQKAHRMIREHKNNQKKFITCLEAGICPTCGKLLRVSNRSSESPRIECEKGCALVSPKGTDYQFITYDIWKKCINNAIRVTAVTG